ncbi:hypothetical protein DPX16_10951 [Anabarilius grahami]|uniref:Uncharacterized protein n=1 Tax=Anabarilius grahami TaxID=495550 RepID=A0A3N0Y9I2_ANAGA|nr:hypothetical protein DPX16_10951 [Anabarilius grahami]
MFLPATRPEQSHAFADRPEPSHAFADRPEHRHVSADRPEPRHVSGSVRKRLGLRSSVADPPLISARAAGIPKHPPAASLSSQPVATLSSQPVATLSSPVAASLSSQPAASLSSLPDASHVSSLIATHSNSPVATLSNSPVATLSNSPVATLSNSPVATLSNSSVATHSKSPMATHSNAPVATHSSALDAMDKMAAPSVLTEVGGVPAIESAPEPASASESAPETAPVGEPSPHLLRRRRRKKASSSPQDADALQEAAVGLGTIPEVSPAAATEPAAPAAVALPALSKLLAHQPATYSVELPKNFLGGGSIPRGGEFVGGNPAQPRSSAASELPVAPDQPWLPEPPDPPWSPETLDLPWLPIAPDPPWPPVAPDPPWLPRLPDPPWLSWNLHWRPCSRPDSNAPTPPLPIRAIYGARTRLPGGGHSVTITICSCYNPVSSRTTFPIIPPCQSHALTPPITCCHIQPCTLHTNHHTQLIRITWTIKDLYTHHLTAKS